MTTVDRYMDVRWSELVEAVKAWVNAGDANLDNDERCRNTWECYAYQRWLSAPLTGLYESDLVDPACNGVCEKLSEFEATALLAWRWSDYLECCDPDVEFPWQMSLEERRSVLIEVFREAVYQEADSDGAEIEERKYFDEDAE